MAYDEAAVRVEVSDDGQPRIRHPLSASGAGQGLQGMRERVEMAGGELTTGPRPNGGWALTAHLPLDGQTPAVSEEPARMVV